MGMVAAFWIATDKGILRSSPWQKRVGTRRCMRCRRRVHLDPKVGQRVGIRCLYCWGVFCVEHARRHFGEPIRKPKPKYVRSVTKVRRGRRTVRVVELIRKRKKK